MSVGKTLGFHARGPAQGADAGFRRYLTGQLADADVNAVARHADRHGLPLVDALVAQGFMAEAQAYRTLAEWMGRPFVDLAEQPPSATAARLLPERVARAHQILALAHDNRTLTYASCTAFDDEVDRDVAFASGRRPQMVVVTRSQIADGLARAYRVGRDVDTLLARIALAEAPRPVERPGLVEEESPIVALCDRLLAQAVEAGASDVHIEPSGNGAAVRHRVCGILEPMLTLPESAVAGVTNRFKVMAQVDIAVRRKPQDGAFRLDVGGQQVDVRLSTVPTIHGEKIVMRVIMGATTALTIDALGYDRASEQALLHALGRTDGLVLVTGPTGSGKTTVLYAALRYLTTGRVNIVTVEDPVERQVEGVTQIAVNSKGGTTFAAALRSVMRQDPNIIMVGEIRDSEVAEIVGQAAYTGHLVLSSLHTSDAASAITRLLNLGLQPFKIAESLNAIIAQRLLRRLCPHCRVVNDEATALRLGARHKVPRVTASVGRGCVHCHETGYKDRLAVPEVLVPDEALRTAIRDGAGSAAIRAAMVAAGSRSMRESAVALVVEGVTSIEEVDRVLTDHGDAATHAGGGPAPVALVTGALEEAAETEGEPPVGIQAADSTGGPAGPRPTPGRRILVADDDRMIRLIVRMLLEKDGFSVIDAENGAVGLSLARRERPDLMLVDLQMPDMDGFTVLDAVRGDAALAGLPVLVLTAETGAAVETKVLEMGADDYLVKPFEPDVLISRVRAAFRRAARAA